ncbi:ComF family protein [Candidatus Saccharibacteria bacterium]|nr:ComF family protein [Candidatus Saccharibacteria bacterium]
MPNIVKNTTTPGILDLIAPHSCRGCGHIGNVICERCKKNILASHHNFCPSCKTPNTNGICQKCQTKSPLPTFVFSERSDLLSGLIYDYKYNSVRALARPLAEFIDYSLPHYDEKIYLVPLPTISRHIRSRGLDHTYAIAKQLAKLHQNYYVSKLLLRNNSSVQVGANAKDRLSQAKTAYSLNPKTPIEKDATYLLIDDVWTTGASMKSAAKLLQESGVKSINLAILAVSV